MENRGTVNASGLQDCCGTNTFGDPAPFSSFTLNGDVPAGSSVTFRSAWADIGSRAPATFTLKCEVDAANRIDELDEGNNRYSTSVSL